MTHVDPADRLARSPGDRPNHRQPAEPRRSDSHLAVLRAYLDGQDPSDPVDPQSQDGQAMKLHQRRLLASPAHPEAPFRTSASEANEASTTPYFSMPEQPALRDQAWWAASTSSDWWSVPFDAAVEQESEAMLLEVAEAVADPLDATPHKTAGHLVVGTGRRLVGPGSSWPGCTRPLAGLNACRSAALDRLDGGRPVTLYRRVAWRPTDRTGGPIRGRRVGT
jgi:hypothetical protein